MCPLCPSAFKTVLECGFPWLRKEKTMTEKNYWRIRTALEIVKLCLWAVLEVIRGTLP
jgi:hypothetical protein